MKFFRTLLLLMLCAMLPLSGLAASGLTGACPMMQRSMAMGDGVAMATMMPDCATTKSSPASKAKGVFCKMTAQCQMGCQYLPVASIEVTRPTGVFSRVAFNYTESLSVREPTGLWRPPRAI